MTNSPRPDNETLLRSSVIVAGGFMGTDTRTVAEIIAADAKALRHCGGTPEQLGARMAAVTRLAREGQGTPVAIGPHREAVAEESRGVLVCPWGCPEHVAKTVTTVMRTDTGARVSWSDLSAHLIAAHGFFQGIGSAYRTEPAVLWDILTIDPENVMDKYVCQVCGYVYDPAQGDAAGKIAVQTPFAQVPEAWKCPMCGAPKRMFRKKK